MAVSQYAKSQRVSLKSHPVLNEKWVQNHIKEDPSILGLGDLVLLQLERIQPRAGRLDLLLQDTDPDAPRRYEVELQLGPTDEAHIVRTLEYWDIERKRYPQYDHCAVLVAEDITSRFLNVISLFNGAVPLIAIQMQALQVGDHLTLVFTKVVDELARGLVGDDEIPDQTPTDRAYWEHRATKSTLAMADKLLGIVRDLDAKLEFNYNRFYIGLVKDGQPDNFVTFRPRKNFLLLYLRLDETETVDQKIEPAGLDTLPYRHGYYRLRLTGNDLETHAGVIRELVQLAYDQRGS